ncbi:MAG TPA: SMC-Scp complex subunit ScpB [Polyangiaceae bacterium LLY-WYZ-15_(1-7)]|nr:SMC-Scp complex subunit ScpB [Polyangiaceae bacterium LLY-WYZ-15_(1-7)]HJL10834.1 SMC-Scp complex subunit ScpB [Polyangiaceae bacterium LLY-WYZ-15_(1-7)]HJL34567.1 SMC-Scp complex subunit ScpB [Polyangiaceae bacterium LLY-WYZ-15_(1-7)]
MSESIHDEATPDESELPDPRDEDAETGEPAAEPDDAPTEDGDANDQGDAEADAEAEADDEADAEADADDDAEPGEDADAEADGDDADADEDADASDADDDDAEADVDDADAGDDAGDDDAGDDDEDEEEPLPPGSDDAQRPGLEKSVAVHEAHLKSVLESLIFVADKPVTARQLARAAKSRVKEVRPLLEELTADYAERGIHLVEVSGGYQFRSAVSSAPFVREFVSRRPVRLTRAQTETLAIVAYRQPVTRPEIDDIRGVDSGSALKVLTERNLLKVLGRKDEPGRPLLYGTTPHFLEFFGMKSLKDLPTLQEFSELSDESRGIFEKRMGEPLDLKSIDAQAAAAEADAASEMFDGEDEEDDEEREGVEGEESPSGEDEVAEGGPDDPSDDPSEDQGEHERDADGPEDEGDDADPDDADPDDADPDDAEDELDAEDAETDPDAETDARGRGRDEEE